jgi:uncharacterized membrane protein
MTWRGSTTVPHRILSCLPYLLPLFYSLAFSGSFFNIFPSLQKFRLRLEPIIQFYDSIPFINIIVFLALFFLVVRNDKVPHIIRFNTMQALLVNILLALASIILPILSNVDSSGILSSTLYSTVFLGVIAIFIYSVIQSLRGVYAEIPTLSDAVYSQVQ